MGRRRVIQTEIVQLFALRLREVRLSRGMKQAELARLATLPPPYISDLENAKVAPGIDLVDRLAKALQTTIADLLPTPPASQTPIDLATQLRQLLDDLIQTAKQDVLETLRSLLTILNDSTRQPR